MCGAGGDHLQQKQLSGSLPNGSAVSAPWFSMLNAGMPGAPPQWPMPQPAASQWPQLATQRVANSMLGWGQPDLAAVWGQPPPPQLPRQQEAARLQQPKPAAVPPGPPPLRQAPTPPHPHQQQHQQSLPTTNAGQGAAQPWQSPAAVAAAALHAEAGSHSGGGRPSAQQSAGGSAGGRTTSRRTAGSHGSRPIKPQPLSFTNSMSAGGRAKRSAEDVTAAISREFGHSLADINQEGSATSDEVNHPKLIPRKGAGPALRTQGGQDIDEYLMRLLRVGAANEAEARLYAEDKRMALVTQPPRQQPNGRRDSDNFSGVSQRGERAGDRIPAAAPTHPKGATAAPLPSARALLLGPPPPSATAALAPPASVASQHAKLSSLKSASALPAISTGDIGDSGKRAARGGASASPSQESSHRAQPAGSSGSDRPAISEWRGEARKTESAAGRGDGGPATAPRPAKREWASASVGGRPCSQGARSTHQYSGGKQPAATLLADNLLGFRAPAIHSRANSGVGSGLVAADAGAVPAAIPGPAALPSPAPLAASPARQSPLQQPLGRPCPSTQPPAEQQPAVQPAARPVPRLAQGAAAAAPSQPPAAAPKAASPEQAAAKALLGQQRWQAVRGTLQAQSAEFQRQLTELHRVAARQHELEANPQQATMMQPQQPPQPGSWQAQLATLGSGMLPPWFGPGPLPPMMPPPLLSPMAAFYGVPQAVPCGVPMPPSPTFGLSGMQLPQLPQLPASSSVPGMGGMPPLGWFAMMQHHYNMPAAAGGPAWFQPMQIGFQPPLSGIPGSAQAAFTAMPLQQPGSWPAALPGQPLAWPQVAQTQQQIPQQQQPVRADAHLAKRQRVDRD